MTCPVVPDVGAYVLGALDSEERQRVEQHVAECAACAAELDELRRLPALLDRLRPEDLEPVHATPSPELFERVAAAAGGRRRPRRRRLLLVAAALAAVLGAGLGIAVWTAGDDPRTWSATAGEVQVTVTASEARDGSRLDVTVDGLPAGQDCRLVVLDREGDRHDAGEWEVEYEGPVAWRSWTEVAPSSLSGILLLGDDGRELARIEP
jgi:hypothetical protein